MDTKGGSVVFDRKDNDVYVGVSRVVESGTAGVYIAEPALVLNTLTRNTLPNLHYLEYSF